MAFRVQLVQRLELRLAATRFRPMAENRGEGRGLARMHLACGRIAGGAQAIAETHRFGVPEGPHRELWTPEYHAAVVHIYGESLPATYQRDIASLFHHSADAMAEQTIPAELAEDWVIVTAYMRHAAAAILSWLTPGTASPRASGATGSPEIDDRTPMVIRFDRLAALCTREGACRLERAALAVQHHVGAPSAVVLDGDQQRLLQGVAAGTAIVDLAEQFGYSRSSMYRELSKLWKALGVPDRAHAIRKATEEGLLY